MQVLSVRSSWTVRYRMGSRLPQKCWWTRAQLNFCFHSSGGNLPANRFRPIFMPEKWWLSFNLANTITTSNSLYICAQEMVADLLCSQHHMHHHSSWYLSPLLLPFSIPFRSPVSSTRRSSFYLPSLPSLSPCLFASSSHSCLPIPFPSPQYFNCTLHLPFSVSAAHIRVNFCL